MRRRTKRENGEGNEGSDNPSRVLTYPKENNKLYHAMIFDFKDFPFRLLGRRLTGSIRMADLTSL